MTNTKNKTGDGGAAFPLAKPSGAINHGMTLRDWLAGQALAAMISCYHYTPTTDETEPNFGGDTGSGPDILASNAYKYADAMLAERAKTTL